MTLSAAAAPAPPARPDGGPARALVVDDVAVNRHVVRRYLERGGFVVEEAETGAAGLAAARNGVDLVVLDVRLPDVNGLDVVRALRADPATAALAVIQTSAYDTAPDDRAAGLEAGSDAYLPQPVNPRELLAVARALVRARRAEAELARLLAAAEAARADAERATGAAESARAQADAANRVKSDVLAVVSHELRTPLNAIDGYAELLELGLHGPVTDEQRVALGRIRDAQRRLLRLVTQVLAYAPLEAGAAAYTLADVVVDEALAACAALIAPQARAREVAVQVAPCAAGAGGALSVRADPEKLGQVVLNLLSNAVKFTDAGGRVAVECEEDAPAGVVRVRVTDTGRGIAADQLARVFDPFVQVDRHRTPASQQGVGLGLAISRDLARGMGGDLTAASQVGAGSAFTLTLPRA